MTPCYVLACDQTPWLKWERTTLWGFICPKHSQYKNHIDQRVSVLDSCYLHPLGHCTPKYIYLNLRGKLKPTCLSGPPLGPAETWRSGELIIAKQLSTLPAEKKKSTPKLECITCAGGLPVFPLHCQKCNTKPLCKECCNGPCFLCNDCHDSSCPSCTPCSICGGVQLHLYCSTCNSPTCDECSCSICVQCDDCHRLCENCGSCSNECSCFNEPDVAASLWELDLCLNLPRVAAQFYWLEYLAYQAPHFKPRFQKFAEFLAGIFSRYIDMAIGGELRYGRSTCKNSNEVMPRIDERISPAPSRGTAWAAWYELRQELGDSILEEAEDALLNGQWHNSAIGGPAWGKCVSLLRMYLNEDIPPAVFVDQAFSLEHNGGYIFNKLWDVTNLDSVLTCKFNGELDKMLKFLPLNEQYARQVERRFAPKLMREGD